jgi:hypothetical protein
VLVYYERKLLFTGGWFVRGEKYYGLFPYLKALLEQEFLKVFIPCSWCLLEPIECLTEFVDMIRTLGIFKTRWLLHIDFFREWSIEKCTLDIHLI